MSESYKCPRCNGTGKPLSEPIKEFTTICWRCAGTGKIDWIQMITGRDKIRTRKIKIRTRKIRARFTLK